MSAESAPVADIEITDTAPAADLSVADVSTIADVTSPAANDPSSENSRIDAANDPAFAVPEPEAEPKALEDTAKKGVDPFNDGPGNDDTFDAKSKRFSLDKMAGESTIGEAGGGPLSQPSAQEREEKRQEAADDFFDMIKERYEEQQRQEEHARKWDQEMHEIGGQQFSGKDLYESAQWFKKAEKRAAFEQQLKQQGATEEEAKKRADKVQAFDELMEKVRKGTASEEEKSRFDAMSKEKQLADDLKTREELKAVDRKVNQEVKKSNIAEIKSENNVFAKPDTSVVRYTAAGPGDMNKPKVEMTAEFNAKSVVQNNESESSIPNPEVAQSVKVAAAKSAPSAMV